jgi:hypothetical protein
MTKEEKEKAILLLRITLGDVPGSPFYPILSDEEYVVLLEANDWNVKKAARYAGYSIVFYLTQTNYRERTGDIEVWNLAATEYRKALLDFLNEGSLANLPTDIRPYVGGVSVKDVCSLLGDPDYIRHPLASISQCSSWWTRVKGYDCLITDRHNGGCGCG